MQLRNKNISFHIELFDEMNKFIYVSNYNVIQFGGDKFRKIQRSFLGTKLSCFYCIVCFTDLGKLNLAMVVQF